MYGGRKWLYSLVNIGLKQTSSEDFAGTQVTLIGRLDASKYYLADGVIGAGEDSASSRPFPFVSGMYTAQGRI